MRLSRSSLGPRGALKRALLEAKNGVPLNLNRYGLAIEEDKPKSIKLIWFYPYLVMMF